MIAIRGRSLIETVPDSFWEVIDAASLDPERLREQLKSMSAEEIVHFCWTYEELAAHLRTERHAAHADPGLSEDGLAELANWAVASGREFYRNVLDHPSTIPSRRDDPGLLSEAIMEYEERFVDDFPFNDREWDEGWEKHGKTSPWA